MKTKKLIVFGFGLMVSLAAFLFANNGHAFAAVKTWDSGGSDEKFSTAANWSGDSVPVNGDSVVLPVDVMTVTCTTDVTLVNDLNPASITLAGVSVTGTNGCGSSSYKTIKITGNELKTSGDLTVPNNIGAYLSVETDVTTTADISMSRVNTISGKTFALGTNALTLNETFMYANLTGSGTVTVAANTFSSLSGTNSGFSGPIIVNGYLSMGAAQDFGTAAGGTTLNSGGTISITTPLTETFTEPITINGGQIMFQYSDISQYATLDWTGSVTVSQDSQFSISSVNLKISGTLTGAEHIKVVDGGTGSITLPNGTVLKSALKTYTINDSNKDTYCYESDYGMYVAPNNKYIWSVSCPQLGKKTGTYGSFGNVYDSQVYGILAGTGVIGSVRIMNGGVIAPGLSPGVLTVSNLTIAVGGSYQVELGGTAAGQYDQIIVNGAVTLGNGTLDPSIYGDFKPAVGNKFTIINNDGTDAVTGTFSGLGEGATFKVGGYVMRISYVGGDGNDVTLTVLSLPGAPDTGFGLITNNPLTSLGVTSALAAGIYVLSRKQKLLFKK